MTPRTLESYFVIPLVPPPLFPLPPGEGRFCWVYFIPFVFSFKIGITF